MFFFYLSYRTYVYLVIGEGEDGDLIESYGTRM